MNCRRTMWSGLALLALGLTACGALSGTPEGIDVVELPNDVEAAVKELVSAETGVSVEEIQVVEAEEREWPNACLGLAEEGEACAQVITPGWRVRLRAGGETYVLRTDAEGSAIRLEE